MEQASFLKGVSDKEWQQIELENRHARTDYGNTTNGSASNIANAVTLDSWKAAW